MLLPVCTDFCAEHFWRLRPDIDTILSMIIHDHQLIYILFLSTVIIITASFSTSVLCSLSSSSSFLSWSLTSPLLSSKPSIPLPSPFPPHDFNQHHHQHHHYRSADSANGRPQYHRRLMMFCAIYFYVFHAISTDLGSFNFLQFPSCSFPAANCCRKAVPAESRCHLVCKDIQRLYSQVKT